MNKRTVSREKWLVGQAVKTPASHAGNGGSIPPRVTKLVLMTLRVHPFPYRTRKLSSVVPKILGWRRPGKIGRCQHNKNRMQKRSVFVLSPTCMGLAWKSASAQVGRDVYLNLWNGSLTIRFYFLFIAITSTVHFNLTVDILLFFKRKSP